MKALSRFIAVLTLAVPGLAFAQAAAAPAPVAQLYGTFNANLQYTEAGDATAGTAADVKPRFAVSIDSTNIGVRGSLDVGLGLKTVYQCETSAAIDAEGVSGICNRNSRLGLQGSFGTIFYGNWDSPYKSAAYGTKADDPFGNTDVFAASAIMGSAGFGQRSAGANGAAPAAAGFAGFDSRVANSVSYHSPKIARMVSFKLQAAADEFRSITGTVDPMLLSGTVNVDVGGLSVAAAAEYREDFYGIRVVNAGNGTTNNAAGKDLGLKLAAGYELPIAGGSLGIVGAVEQLQYKQDDAVGATAAKEYTRLAWHAGAKFRTGPHEIRVRYSQAMAPDITAATGATLAANAEDDLGAQDIAVGYAYHLGRTTQVYAFWTQIMNDDRARYTFSTSGNAAVFTMAAAQSGADPTAGGIGFRQAF